MTWNFGNIYCMCYRYFYYAFLFFLPLTILFLAWHLFVENCKWNFAGKNNFLYIFSEIFMLYYFLFTGEEGSVPRPWPHTIFIPLIWLFSLLFAVPTIFYSSVRNEKEDFYRNEIEDRPSDALVSTHSATPLTPSHNSIQSLFKPGKMAINQEP